MFQQNKQPAPGYYLLICLDLVYEGMLLSDLQSYIFSSLHLLIETHCAGWLVTTCSGTQENSEARDTACVILKKLMHGC